MEPTRVEAERLLGIAEKLLRSKDYGGCRDFAILAQETEPLLEGSDQILAIAEVIHASENKRQNNQPEWYSVLQIPQRTDEHDLIKKQYRRLALLLHPDKNKFPFADSAFRLVADSWAVLSDPVKKSAYDGQIASRFTKVDLPSMKTHHQYNQHKKKQPKAKGSNSHTKLPVRRSARGDAVAGSVPENPAGVGFEANRRSNPNLARGNFWTACPYCYILYEYPRVYEGCCLRCDNGNCSRAFTATPILSMPPLVPGSEAYYCCWGFFPMGFSMLDSGKANAFPKWMPPMFGEGGVQEEAAPAPAPPSENVTPAQAAAPPARAAAPPARASAASSGRKRGRPRKNAVV